MNDAQRAWITAVLQAGCITTELAMSYPDDTEETRRRALRLLDVQRAARPTPLEFGADAVLTARRVSELVNPPVRSEVQPDGTIRYTVIENDPLLEEDMTNEEIVNDILPDMPSASTGSPLITPKIRKSFTKGTATVLDMCKACYELGKGKTDAEKDAIMKQFQWVSKRGLLLGVKTDDMPALSFAKDGVLFTKEQVLEFLMNIYNADKSKLDDIMKRNASKYERHIKSMAAKAKAELKKEVDAQENNISRSKGRIDEYTASLMHNYNALSKAETLKAQAQAVVDAFSENSYFERVMNELKDCPYIIYKVEGDVLYFYPKEDCIIKFVNPSAGVNLEINFGRLGIRINMQEKTIKCLALKNNLQANDYIHPHVSGQSICMGNASSIIGTALAKGDFKTLLCTLNDLLCQYNPGSPYVQLEEFKRADRINTDAVIPEIDYTPEQYDKYISELVRAGQILKFVGPANGIWDGYTKETRFVGKLISVYGLDSNNHVEILGYGSCKFPRSWFTIPDELKAINAYQLEHKSVRYYKFKITAKAAERARLVSQYADRVFEIRELDIYDQLSQAVKIKFYACVNEDGYLSENRFVYLDDVDLNIDQSSDCEWFENEEDT